MYYFLTSNPMNYQTKELNPANTFVEKVKSVLPTQVSALFVCSDPRNYAFTDNYARDFQLAFEAAGIGFESYSILDERTADKAAELVAQANLIFLAGGHVPTQNAFFHSIGLAKLLRTYDHIVIGSSAGSMNAAESVYAQPEEEGEAVSKDYQRFLQGLGLTEVSLIPHYQETKNQKLDGLRVFEDIAYPDSMGTSFYAISDGTYLYGDGDSETLYGQAYLIQDGKLSQLTSDNETYQFRK